MACMHTEYEASEAAEIYAGIGGCFICLESELATMTRERDALHTEITALREALRALLIVMDRGAQPRKLDEAITWRENDNKARAMALVALGEIDAKRKE